MSCPRGGDVALVNCCFALALLITALWPEPDAALLSAATAVGSLVVNAVLVVCDLGDRK